MVSIESSDIINNENICDVMNAFQKYCNRLSSDIECYKMDLLHELLLLRDNSITFDPHFASLEKNEIDCLLTYVSTQ